MGWSDHYESSFSQVLHNCLTRMCTENLPVEGKVEIDALVCINIAGADKQIVLKVHEIVDKSKGTGSGSGKKHPPAPGGAQSKGFVPINKQKGTALSLLNAKARQSEMDMMTQAARNRVGVGLGGVTPGLEAEEAFMEFYKKEMLAQAAAAAQSSANVKKTQQVSLHPMSEPSSKQHNTTKPSPVKREQEALPVVPSGGSRRKQAKPQMVTHVPDDDDEEDDANTGAMSTDADANEVGEGDDGADWFSDSASSGGVYSSSAASLSLLPYNAQQRPPRQRVPLKDEIQTGLAPLPTDFACRKCNRMFPGFAPLQVHNMEAHKRYTCKQCHTTFSLRCNLRRHERLHEGHKPFQCQWCPKTFSRNGDLKIHEWKHKEGAAMEPTNAAEMKNADFRFKQETEMENGMEDEGIIVIEPTDADEDGYASNDSSAEESSTTAQGAQARMNHMFVGNSPMDMSRKVAAENASAFSAVRSSAGESSSRGHDTSSSSPVVAMLAQKPMKSVSKDSSCGGSVESAAPLDFSQISQSVISSLYNKYISGGSSPKTALADLAQVQMQESLGLGMGRVLPGVAMSSLLSQAGNHSNNTNKSSKKGQGPGSKSSSYPAVNEALKDWSSAPNSPASSSLVGGGSRNLNSPSPGPPPPPHSSDNSPKGSPKAAPVPRSQHYCLLCKDWWDDFTAYESHCAGVHGRYPCQYCGQTFSNKNNRARHGRSHTGQKQFTCGHCGKSFTRSDILREHQIIHTESYHGDQCQYCGTKITTKKADLLSHIKKCIQLHKYSPNLIQAKIEAAANGVESTLPLEYTPGKYMPPSGDSLDSNLPLAEVERDGVTRLSPSEEEGVSPLGEVGGVPPPSSKISPRSLLSNNNMGEKTPPKQMFTPSGEGEGRLVIADGDLD